MLSVLKNRGFIVSELPSFYTIFQAHKNHSLQNKKYDYYNTGRNNDAFCLLEIYTISPCLYYSFHIHKTPSSALPLAEGKSARKADGKGLIISFSTYSIFKKASLVKVIAK